MVTILSVLLDGDTIHVRFTYQGRDFHGNSATIHNKADIIDEDYFAVIDKACELWGNKGYGNFMDVIKTAVELTYTSPRDFSYPLHELML